MGRNTTSPIIAWPWPQEYIITGVIVAEILEAPTNITVGLNQDPLTLTCRVRGDNVFIRVDGDIINHNTAMDFREKGITATNGIYNGVEITQRVTVELSVINNNTNIICHSTAVNEPRADSEPGFIVIAG